MEEKLDNVSYITRMRLKEDTEVRRGKITTARAREYACLALNDLTSLFSKRGTERGFEPRTFGL